MRDAGHRTPDAGHRTAKKAKIIYPPPRGVDIKKTHKKRSVEAQAVSRFALKNWGGYAFAKR